MIRVPFELKPFPKPTDIPKPVLQITIINPNNDMLCPLIGLVDTGADYTTLPIDFQYTLGLDLKKVHAKQNLISCACENKKLFSYSYKLEVSFTDINKKEHKKPLWIHFIKSNTPVLIGRNFMDLFNKIYYDNKKKIGFFEELKKKE